MIQLQYPNIKNYPTMNNSLSKTNADWNLTMKMILFFIIGFFGSQLKGQQVNIEFPAKGASWTYSNNKNGSSVKYLFVKVIADSIPQPTPSEFVDSMHHFVFKCILQDDLKRPLDSFQFILAKYLRNWRIRDTSFYNKYIFLVIENNGFNYSYIANFLYNNASQPKFAFHPKNFDNVDAYTSSREKSTIGWLFTDSTGCYLWNNKSFWGYKYLITRDYAYNPKGAFCVSDSAGLFIDRFGNLNGFMIPIDTCSDTQLGNQRLIEYRDDELGVVTDFSVKRCDFNLSSIFKSTELLRLYPNPVKMGSSLILSNIKSKSHYSIGHEVNNGYTQGEIKIETMKSGFYYLILDHNEQMVQIPFMVVD